MKGQDEREGGIKGYKNGRGATLSMQVHAIRLSNSPGVCR